MPAPKTPLLGLCPIGKFVFSHEDALRQKVSIQERFREWGVRYVDIEGVVPDGLIRDQQHVESAVHHFRHQSIDALFLPHCNFGTESAVGAIARALGVPVLLWGPRDEAPLEDGTRLRDSLCGLFASGKILHKLGVQFTYLENCRMDEPSFHHGVRDFLRAVAAASVFRCGSRIGHIGQRIDFFWTTIVNEGELLERFNIETHPIGLVDFIEHIRDRAAKGRRGYEKEAAEWRAKSDIVGFPDDTPLLLSFAMRDQMFALAHDHGIDAFSTQDFPSLCSALNTYDFFALSFVTEQYPVGIESDIHGAISALILHRAALGDPVFLTDLTTRHPENDNGILLWHAGAPFSMAHPEEKIRVGHHWILPSQVAGMPHFRLNDGPITTARFDGDRGNYQLAVGEGRTIPGPYTLNNYLWMEVDNWPRWERTLVEGSFIHHTAMTYGHVGPALKEACRYINGLEYVGLGGDERE